MRIALDATPLIHSAGGIPRYVTELALALAETFPGDEIHLLTDQNNWTLDPALASLRNVIAEPPRSKGPFGKWWSIGLPLELRRREIDVFHGVDFSIPYIPAAPAVLSLHDLSPWKPPPLCPPGSERVRRRTPVLLRLADLILTPTEAVRREASNFFGVDPARIRAIPHAPARRLANLPAREAEAALARLGVRQPYLLYAGARNARKNLAVLVEAWLGSRGILPDLNLVLAGPGQSNIPGNSPPGFIDLGETPDDGLAALLSSARIFVYPSLYEGFGLPVLEAMNAGVPVIASNDPALVEVSGGAGLHVDVSSPTTLTEAIVRVATDEELRRLLRRLGIKRAAEFGWPAAARHTRRAYEDAIRRR